MTRLVRPRALPRVATVAVIAMVAPAVRSSAQDSAATRVTDVPVNPSAAPAPFGPGERLTYDVKIGWFNVGKAEMVVEGIDTVAGEVTYHARMSIHGGLLAAKVNDDSESWFDVRDFASRRFLQKIHEVNYKSFRDYRMHPDERMWDRADNDESGPLASLLPLDDISFVYFLRTIPMTVGKTYTYHRYFKEDGNPVVVRVVGRAVRKEDSGTYNTVVVKPIIRTRGLFSEGGQAELYFTDDDRRILVYLKSDVPHFPGSLTLHLDSIQEGLPLNPASRASALARRDSARADSTRSR
jgi:Protein of unknown function (DUF3108)